ncbi:MAG: DUF4238 domain-containing protein [Candidatus Sumerlaeota bacterium]|nr:DUF4238 domain-containing protein [Candidatus Sumerlaeota bacterium]
MGKGINQHFVPQFYFRQFTEGKRYVQLLRKDTGQIIHDASVKGQCAHYKLYGSEDIEAALSELEQTHAQALKRLIRYAWFPEEKELDTQTVAWMWQAILLQRTRTRLEFKKSWPSMESLHLAAFKEYLKHASDINMRQDLIDIIEKGTLHLKVDEGKMLLLDISVGLSTTLLISDLDFYLVRNKTDYPFLFSDSPVVFYNQLYRNVSRRGVLGLQTPGLQIFFPLDSRTLLLLLDGSAYGMPFSGRFLVDISRPYDVSQINSLQLHHSLNAVYFAEAKASEYVSSLWLAHRNTLSEPKCSFNIREGWLVDGKPEDRVFQTFEQHLNFHLDLTFIKCNPISEANYVFRHRSPELVEENRRNLLI